MGDLLLTPLDAGRGAVAFVRSYTPKGDTFHLYFVGSEPLFFVIPLRISRLIWYAAPEHLPLQATVFVDMLPFVGTSIEEQFVASGVQQIHVRVGPNLWPAPFWALPLPLFCKCWWPRISLL